MEKTTETTPTQTTQTTETTEKKEILEETNENDIICPTCNKEQLIIINVKICEAENSIWNKCSVTTNCPLFQIKSKK
jgi:hypothetical protein